MSSGWDRWAPLTGVAMIVAFGGEAVSSGTEPSTSASGATVIAFYQTHRDRIAVGDYLLGLAVVFGLFFYGFVCEHVRVREGSPLLARVAFGGAVVFVLSGALGAGASLCLTSSPGKLEPGAAQALNVAQNLLVSYADNTGAAVLLIAAGIAIVRGRGLPVWTGWLALLLSLVTFAPVMDVGALAAGLWTLVLSLTMLVRTAQSPARPAEPLHTPTPIPGG